MDLNECCTPEFSIWAHNFRSYLQPLCVTEPTKCTSYISSYFPWHVTWCYRNAVIKFYGFSPIFREGNRRARSSYGVWRPLTHRFINHNASDAADEEGKKSTTWCVAQINVRSPSLICAVLWKSLVWYWKFTGFKLKRGIGTVAHD